jgi:hypothetical protein
VHYAYQAVCSGRFVTGIGGRGIGRGHVDAGNVRLPVLGLQLLLCRWRMLL